MESTRRGRVSWSWGAFLAEHRWCHMATLTFRSPVSAESARQRYKTWMRRLEQRAQQSVSGFAAIETVAGAHVHLHTLVGGTDRLEVRDLEQAWSFGRRQVRLYRSVSDLKM
jgi:hypothetical protein